MTKANAFGNFEQAGFQDESWVAVIHKMEEVYSDLIRYEVDLEGKNAALEEAQSFIDSVLSSMSDAFIVCDLDGRIEQVNAAAARLVGRPRAELVGRPLKELLIDADGKLLARLERHADDGECNPDQPECEVRLNGPDGPTDSLAMNCSDRLDRAGRRVGLVLIGRPVGELRRAYEALNLAHADLKRAQMQLVQAEKMASLGRLVAGVAHELNNPISFVYGNIHALDRYRGRLAAYLAAIHAGVDEAEREALRRDLGIDALMADLSSLIEGTLEGAQRVGEIVKNLRRLTFAGSGEPERVDLAKLIANAVHWAERGHRQRADIQLDLTENLWVRGHAGQLHQVVVNLVQNALDAVADLARPRIAVSAGLVEGKVRLVIADNGPGIAADHLLKVFDPFFTTKPVGSGTGLGLWISYGIVRDHGGTIEVANGPDGGAQFTVTLPPPEDGSG